MSYREILQSDPLYPALLHRFKNPPERLYADGDVTLLQRRRVAIIGSRHPSNYGIVQAYEAARALAGQGAVVVSGMAIGLDARAHRGALDAGGGTIAVLGAGIDWPGPEVNRDLLRETRLRGLVLSEHPPGLGAAKYTFPMRNRIIAALAECLLVVEGRVKGGTSNTLAWALQVLGEEAVFGVPGRLDDELATGPNFLIRDGGRIYTHPNDILLTLRLPTLPEQPRAQSSKPEVTTRANLSLAEATLFDLIGRQPLHVDALASKSALEPGLLLAALSSLELQGLVTQLPGKHFALAS